MESVLLHLGHLSPFVLTLCCYWNQVSSGQSSNFQLFWNKTLQKIFKSGHFHNFPFSDGSYFPNPGFFFLLLANNYLFKKHLTLVQPGQSCQFITNIIFFGILRSIKAFIKTWATKRRNLSLDIPIFHTSQGCPASVDTNWGSRADKKKGKPGTQGFFRATFWLLYSFLWNACWTKTSRVSQTFQLRVFSPTYFSYYSYSPAWVKLKQAWNNFINIKPHDNGKQSLLMVYFLIILWYISSSPPSRSATTFWFHSAAWAWQGSSIQHGIL